MKLEKSKQERLRLTSALASGRPPQLEAEPFVKDHAKQLEDQMNKERGKTPPTQKLLE